MATKLLGGVVHKIPADLRQALSVSENLGSIWNKLTPLGRNEWICWTISVKKVETRAGHVSRLVEEIQDGKKRPCCWPGCSHR